MGRPRNPDSTLSQIDAFVNSRKETKAADIVEAFPNVEHPHALLTSLERAGRVQRIGRGTYGPAKAAESAIGAKSGKKARAAA